MNRSSGYVGWSVGGLLRIRGLGGRWSGRDGSVECVGQTTGACGFAKVSGGAMLALRIVAEPCPGSQESSQQIQCIHHENVAAGVHLCTEASDPCPCLKWRKAGERAKACAHGDDPVVY